MYNKLAVFSFLSTWLFSVHVLAMAPESSEKSLYEKLGGVYNIATLVDDVVERLLVNETLNANPKIAQARDHVPKAGLKYRVTEFMCQMTGGPQQYTGRNMVEAHQHLHITQGQWDAMMVDFKKSLTHFNVPEEYQVQLVQLMEKTKPDIVKEKDI